MVRRTGVGSLPAACINKGDNVKQTLDEHHEPCESFECAVQRICSRRFMEKRDYRRVLGPTWSATSGRETKLRSDIRRQGLQSDVADLAGTALHGACAYKSVRASS